MESDENNLGVNTAKARISPPSSTASAATQPPVPAERQSRTAKAQLNGPNMTKQNAKLALAESEEEFGDEEEEEELEAEDESEWTEVVSSTTHFGAPPASQNQPKISCILCRQRS
jgi:hypothetical protein